MNWHVRTIFLTLVLWAVVLPEVDAKEPTSQTSANLKQVLRLYPDADLNKDGILTRSERQEYQKQLLLKGNPLPKPDAAQVKYGPHDRNVLDLWLAQGNGPRPLAVFIHGGGWAAGDKSMLPVDDLRRLRSAGVTVVSINYRYSTQDPFPAPMRDAGLAIQFLRHQAGRYNIDPRRVAAYGVSAGGVTSLWLAFHDDFADPNAPDPVLRQSTRLRCAGSIVGPTTVDKKTMDDWFGMKVAAHPAFYPFYGVPNGQEQELYSDRVREIGQQASPINHLSKDDPPVFLDFPQDIVELSEKANANEVVHHPLFGVKLKEAADKIGVEANFQAGNKPQDRYENLIDFLIVKLEAAGPPASGP
jgi:acetyl esterase